MVVAWTGATLSTLALLGLLWRIARRLDQVVRVADQLPGFMEGAREEFRVIWFALGKVGAERPSEQEFPTVVSIWRPDRNENHEAGHRGA